MLVVNCLDVGGTSHCASLSSALRDCRGWTESEDDRKGILNVLSHLVTAKILVHCRDNSWQRQLLGKEGGLTKGHISPRMGVIIAYLALLHLAVMMCFTRHHSAPDCLLHTLPGR